MARKKREISSTGIYHIMLRGVNSLFLADNDYETFLALLRQKAKSAKVISYVLLKNRIHLVVDAGGENIGTVLKPIATSYARYCNRTRGMRGKLFYDRFKSEPVSSKEELLNAVAFLNFIVKEQGALGYSSLYNPVCIPKDCGLTEKEAKSTEFSKLIMEDYGCLSKSELANYMYAFGGIAEKDFKQMSPDMQKEMAEKFATGCKYTKADVFEVLGIKKHSKTNKKTENEEKKLSVWLL